MPRTCAFARTSGMAEWTALGASEICAVVLMEAGETRALYERLREPRPALIGVSGVGGNTARMILSTFSSDEVRTIISTGQADVLKSVKGLGIKTAQKIIVELRDKLGVLPGGDAQLPMQAAGGESFAEALSALMMLGFAKPASEKVLRALVKEQPQAQVEELIRMALKRL